MRKLRNIASVVIISIALVLLTVTISAKNLNIRSAIITSVEYSIGNGEWYSYDDLKAKMWNITNVYIRVTCDLELIEELTYDSVDCFINAEGYENYIACYGNINKENNTIVITTKDALNKNFGYGYLRIGDPNNSSSVLLGETLELDLINNWSGVNQEVSINVQYGAGENGPWRDREIEVLDDILETKVLHEIYVKVQATTNVGNMKSVIIMQNKNQVANGVDELVYKVKSNTKEFKIVAESESRISMEQTFEISNLGEYGKKEKEFIKISREYGFSEEGPWYDKESDVLEEILEDETLEKIYVRASATTNVGNIISIKINQRGKELVSGIDSAICEVKQNTTENTMLEIVANSESGEVEKYTVEIFNIGERGKKEKRDITIDVRYSLNEEGPWYDNESVMLNDISADKKIDMIYVNVQAKVNKGNIRKVAILQNDEELKSGINGLISSVTSNMSDATKFYIRAESDNGIEETMALNITKIGSYGVKNEEKIEIDVRYGLSEGGPWYENQKDIMSDVLEYEKVEKIYMKVEATTNSGSITNITIKDDSKVITSKSSGIVIQEFDYNTKGINITAKSNRSVVMSSSVEISYIGEVGIREDIEVLVKYAIGEDGVWYDTESQLLVREEAVPKEYIKISAKSNKKDIESIEIKRGETSLAFSNTGDLIHYFEENMDGVSIIVTSGSGEVVSQNIEIAGVEKDEIQIEVKIKYGISNGGPWRNSEEDILNDVKSTEKVNAVYIKAIGEVDKGSILGIEINDGESTTSESSSVVIHKFTKNTSGNKIRIVATDDSGHKAMWTGDITKIGDNGIKNSTEDGKDSVIYDITEDFSDVDWDIRKNIDWRKGLVSEMELKLKDEYTNVPDILVSKVGGRTDVAMVSLKNIHEGEEGYNIRYRLGNKEEDKSIDEVVVGAWQEYKGPFVVSTNTYVEAEGRFNEDNPSHMTAMQIIDLEEISGAMYIMNDKNMPLTINKQYYVAYYDNANGVKGYKKGNGSWVSLGGGNMFVIDVNGGSNTTITLKEEVDGIAHESIEYVVDNGITMSVEKISTDNEEKEGRYKYRVKLEPGEKITDATIKEVGIMGEYTFDGVVNGIVRKTNSIIDKNGIFEFEIKNAPAGLTCKAYYINEENEMVVK